MSNFSAAAELDVTVSQGSLQSARATIEDELGDVEVNASASNQLASGGSRMAGRERAMSRSLLSDQNSHLATLRDTLDVNINLNEERNDILREILDAQEMTARQEGGGGRLMGMGLAGLGLIGGGITLAAGAIFSIGEKLVAGVSDLINIGKKIVPDVDDLLEIGKILTVPVASLIEIGKKLVVDASELIEVGEPVPDPSADTPPAGEPTGIPWTDGPGAEDPTDTPVPPPTGIPWQRGPGADDQDIVPIDGPVSIPTPDPVRQPIGSVTTAAEPEASEDWWRGGPTALALAGAAGLTAATGGAGAGIAGRLVGGTALGAALTGAAAGETESTRGTPNRNETNVEATIQQDIEVALELRNASELAEIERNPERWVNDKIDTGRIR